MYKFSLSLIVIQRDRDVIRCKHLSLVIMFAFYFSWTVEKRAVEILSLRYNIYIYIIIRIACKTPKNITLAKVARASRLRRRAFFRFSFSLFRFKFCIVNAKLTRLTMTVTPYLFVIRYPIFFLLRLSLNRSRLQTPITHAFAL